MFIIDDLLLRSLGVQLPPPFDTIYLMELMRDNAIKQKYNIKEINNQIKENRFLFDIGEITREEFKEKHELLMMKLDKAKEVIESLKDIRIKEGIHA